VNRTCYRGDIRKFAEIATLWSEESARRREAIGLYETPREECGHFSQCSADVLRSTPATRKATVHLAPSLGRPSSWAEYAAVVWFSTVRFSISGDHTYGLHAPALSCLYMVRDLKDRIGYI